MIDHTSHYRYWPYDDAQLHIEHRLTVLENLVMEHVTDPPEGSRRTAELYAELKRLRDELTPKGD